jgi:hypothetical protein
MESMRQKRKPHKIIIIIIIMKEQYIKSTLQHMPGNRGTIGQKKHRYEHVPKSVETGQGGNVKILWIQQV